MVGRIAHLKYDDDLRIKGRDAKRLEVRAGIEDEAIGSSSLRCC